MCGIAGSITKNFINNLISSDVFNLLNHRGPDYRKKIVIREKEKIISFFHTRLSIIDLSERSAQPMTKQHATLIFNGEIYNYLEIKNYLETKGYKFKTSSDTEVLLSSYLYWGEDCVKKFNGMWSFAIWDKKKKKLFLSRDRFGEKPLYYYSNGSEFFFASETKALRKLADKKFDLNDKLLSTYLVFGHKYMQKSDKTFFKKIKLLEPGTNLSIKKENIFKKKYWKVPLNTHRISLDDAVDGVREHIKRSMFLRLRSDVPIAFYLSGGIDSNYLLGMSVKKLNYNPETFSVIDTDERYNEIKNIEKTKKFLAVKNHKYLISNDSNHLSNIEKLTKSHDSPIATISSYLSYMLSKQIKKKGYKVSVSGIGADEIFSGYYEHSNLNLLDFSNSEKKYKNFYNNWKKKIRPFIRNPYLRDMKNFFNNKNFFLHRIVNYEIFSQVLIKVNLPEKEYITKHKSFCTSNLRNRMLNELFYEGTQIQLIQDDKNSMINSIENRSPFLDSNLVEFVYSLPQEYLINNGIPKFLLRKSGSNIISKNVCNDLRKKGFNADITSIINFDSKNVKNRLLESSLIYEFLSKDKIEKMLKIKKFTNSYKKFLFNFISAKYFLDNNF